jgi:uncharacterized membrane-anchored protein YitT (DUF2179 family)
MNKYSRVKKKAINYLYDHPKEKWILKNTYMVIMTALSALIFSFGFKAFISPNYQAFGSGDFADVAIQQLASCGASGLSQSLVSILKLAGVEWIKDGTNQHIVNFVFYFVINIPLFLLSWFKIGKKFTIYTILNVGLVTVFGIFLPASSSNDFISEVAENVYAQPVSRILFAGITTGVSSALAYSIETSAGGIDVLAYYLSEKKSVQIGGYSAFLNSLVVLLFTILSVIPGGLVVASGSIATEAQPFVAVKLSIAFIIMLYTVIYTIISSLVVDKINVKNKKVSVQIITQNENLSQVILANIPHGCTIVNGKGGYTGEKMFVIYMSVRKNEAKRVVEICRNADPSCFISVMPMEQVYGKFYRKPVE